ncbi:hypothetical protein BHM03_00037214 [Ensete ventricosum]|nr:hypothetical protein BHM03_00037214 [Ensete ventricosum]
MARPPVGATSHGQGPLARGDQVVVGATRGSATVARATACKGGRSREQPPTGAAPVEATTPTGTTLAGMGNTRRKGQPPPTQGQWR